MSLSSWRREFYPITAKQAAKKGDLVACEHSLVKWQGALPAALKRHGGKIAHGFYRGLVFDRTFDFGSDECALCQRHLYGAKYSCDQCPVVLAGAIDCTKDTSAYQAFEDTGDPKPMIRVLKSALVHIKKAAK